MATPVVRLRRHPCKAARTGNPAIRRHPLRNKNRSTREFPPKYANAACVATGESKLWWPVMESVSRRTLLNYIAIAILIFGMAIAEFIYWRSLQQPAPPEDADSPYNSKVYEQEMEKNVGVFGVIMDQWARSAAALAEPRPLAITIAVVSLLVAGGCFAAAARMPRE